MIRAILLIALAIPCARVFSQSRDASALEYDLYLAQIAAAEAFLQLNNVSTAKEYLDSCDMKYRDIEWYFLDAFLDQSASVVPKPEGAAFTDVRISPDGTLIAAAGSDSVITLYNYPDFSVARQLHGHRGAVTTLGISSDGKLLASGGRDHAVFVWDVKTGNRVWTNDTSFTQGIYQVRFSPDGGTVGVVTWDLNKNRTPQIMGFASLLASDDGRQMKRLDAEAHPAAGIVFADSGKTVVVACWGEIVRAYDAATGERRWVYDLSGPEEYNAFYSIDLSPDGASILVGSADHRVHILSAKGELRHRIEPWEGHTKIVKAVAYSPDGSLFATAGDDQTIRVWDTAGRTKKHSLIGHKNSVTGLAWSRSGNELISVGKDGMLRVWDLDNLFERSYTVCDFGPWMAPVTSDRRKFVAACSDKKLVVYSIKTGKPAATLGEQSGLAADISADDRYLATSSFDGVVRLWDLKSGGQSVLGKHAGRVDGIGYLNSTGQVVSVGDTTLRVWNRDTSQSPRVVPMPVKPFRLTLSRDDNTAWVGASSGIVTAYDTKSWKETVSFRADNGLQDMAVSPDGHRLALFSGSSIEIWNTTTRKREMMLSGHMQPGYGVGFSPDGRYLISGSNDQTFKLWNLANGRCTLTFHGYEETIYTSRFLSDKEIFLGSSTGAMHYFDFRSRAARGGE